MRKPRNKKIGGSGVVMESHTVEIYRLKHYPEWIDKWDFELTVKTKLKKIGLYNRVIDAIHLAQSIPNLVLEKRYFDLRVGGMCCKMDYLSTIYINSKRPEKIQQFDCMHELIHFLFHPSGLYVSRDNRDLHRIYDLQANWGAIEAKMPIELFKQKAIELNLNISELSNFFHIGEVAVQNRINKLSWNDHFPGSIQAINKYRVVHKFQEKIETLWSISSSNVYLIIK